MRNYIKITRKVLNLTIVDKDSCYKARRYKTVDEFIFFDDELSIQESNALYERAFANNVDLSADVTVWQPVYGLPIRAIGVPTNGS